MLLLCGHVPLTQRPLGVPSLVFQTLFVFTFLSYVFELLS